MHAPSTDYPRQSQLIYPLLEAIAAAGGAVRATDAAALLASRFGVRTEVTERTKVIGNGQIVNLWRRHVRFARQKALAMGYVAAGERGSWTLTDHGYQGLARAHPTIVVELLRDPDGTPRAARIELAMGVPTSHLLVTADARDLSFLLDNSIQLVVTSAPYHDLKRYRPAPGQLGSCESYEAFLDKLDAVWRECYRVLAPGGTAAINLGDVLRSRSKHGEHHVLPLHADVLSRTTRMGFRALTGIIWNKIGNCSFENQESTVLGQPGQPNGIVRAELEHIIRLRKPAPSYRSATPAQRRDSAIASGDYARWFRPIWNDVSGTRTTGAHPAPFPVEIPYRLIRMFSMSGDCVLDPFSGSATTALAAAMAGRSSVCADVVPEYTALGIERLRRAAVELHAAA